MADTDRQAEIDALPSEARVRKLLDMGSPQILSGELRLAYRKGVAEGLRYPEGRERAAAKARAAAGAKLKRAKLKGIFRWLLIC